MGAQTHFNGGIAIDAANDVVFLTGSGVPTDAVTGAGEAAKGSVYVDYTNGNLYVNGGAGTKASPVWKLVTKAA
jgi:hypothetical protein